MCIRQSEYLLLAREIWPRAHARTPSCAPCPTRARASCATSTRHAPRPCLSPASPCQFISTVHTGGAGPEHTPLDPGAPSRRSIPALHLVAPILALHLRARPIPLYRAPGWRAIPARRPWPCRFSVSQPFRQPCTEAVANPGRQAWAGSAGAGLCRKLWFAGMHTVKTEAHFSP